MTFLFTLTVGEPNMQLMERTTVRRVINGWKSTGTDKSIGEEPGSSVRTSHLSYTAAFREKVENLGKERWAARRILMTEEIGGVISSLENGTAVGVSDGSFQHKFGTACFIIENKEGTERIVGLIDVPGFSDEHDAYRSELAGLYGLVRATMMLQDIGKLKGGGIPWV